MSLMHWISINELEGKSFNEVWNCLQDMKEELDISYPSLIIEISEISDSGWHRGSILEQLEKKEKVLEILGKSKENLGRMRLKIKRTKFDVCYKKAEDKHLGIQILPQPTRTLTLQNGQLIYGKSRTPMERGQKKMMQVLLQNAREYKGSKLTKKGGVTNRKALEKASGYIDEGAWRNALGEIRKKIKNNKLPVKIKSETTNNYIMEIRYPATNK